jgi:hypothetical protein
MGSLGAVESFRDLGFGNVMFEGDSKQVVAKILSKEPNWCKYGHIVGVIHEVLESFSRWEIGHVKRTANKAATG